MNDDISDTWKRDEPDSPCVNICVIHPNANICIGCMRTMDEIAAWPIMNADLRAALKDQLPNRAGQLKSRRRGRAGRLQKVPKL